MKRKYLGTALVIGSLALTPATPVMAGAGEAIVGGIIGGIIGGAIVNGAKKKKVVSKRVVRRPAISTAARADNIQVQTALNYFGFNAGTADGAIGPRSRSAIASMQATLGYAATGQLTQFEHDFLLMAYNRAQAGGGNTLARIAQDPRGATGLLIAYRDEMLAGGTTPPATLEAAAPAPAAPQPEAPAETLAAAAPALPSFGKAGGKAEASLTSFCNQVSLVTGTNGGYATLASLSDPDQALNEQFCLARTYAVSNGEAMSVSVADASPEQLNEQCRAFGDVMAEPLVALAVRQPDAVLADVGEIIVQSGMSQADLSAAGRICLSVGYRTDDMKVAIGSALLLAGLGEAAYDELLGHHLMRGFGVTANPGLARAWYQLGVDALDGGQAAVFAPGQPERTDLIRAVALGTQSPSPVIPAFGFKAPQALPGNTPVRLPQTGEATN